MAERKGMEVSIGIAEAVGQADVDVISAYPITPQTHIVEHLSEMVAEGHLNADFVPVESEHTAMSVCVGSSAVGARSFTATSSQGLALMNEIVYIAASMRLPMVMCLVNRSLSGQLSIWNDHSDVMSVRDCGWIQVFVNNGQEAYDHVFWSFRVTEDHDVLTPVMFNVDGFILSHVIEPIIPWTKEQVGNYLPPFDPKYRLHPDKPLTMGAFTVPEIYTEARMSQNQGLLGAKPTILKAWQELKEITGREYKPVESYRTEGAKLLLITMGSYTETASVAVDSMRDLGEEVGLVSLRLWRPFPFEELKEAIEGAEAILVIDRALSFGGPGGPVASEIKAALYNMKKKPRVINIIAGLAGRDVSPDDYWQMVEQARQTMDKGNDDQYVIYGVRE